MKQRQIRKLTIGEGNEIAGKNRWWIMELIFGFNLDLFEIFEGFGFSFSGMGKKGGFGEKAFWI